MTAVSMTGFARARGTEGDLDWTWELKSVNGKGLELRFRLPPGCDGLEVAARQAVQSRLKRGSVQASLTLSQREVAPKLAINPEALAAVAEAIRSLEAAMHVQPPTADGLLRIKGVIDEQPVSEIDVEARDRVLLLSLTEALDALVKARTEEGARIGEVLNAQLARIADITAQARSLAALAPEAVKRRLADQVAKLVEASSTLNADRLHQEAALLAGKADVTEELDRLNAHVAQARDLLSANEPAGRRLDFLCQEFTREANTLCSKSYDITLTRLGLDLKAVIEQFREQVQNIE